MGDNFESKPNDTNNEVQVERELDDLNIHTQRFYEDSDNLRKDVLISELRIKSLIGEIGELKTELEETDKRKSPHGKKQKDLVRAVEGKLEELRKESKFLSNLSTIAEVTRDNLKTVKFPGEERLEELDEVARKLLQEKLEQLQMNSAQVDEMVKIVREQQERIENVLGEYTGTDALEKYRPLPDEDVNWELKNNGSKNATPTQFRVTDSEVPTIKQNTPIKSSFHIQEKPIDPKHHFDGLTKSELQHYGHDPYWRWIRWLCFMFALVIWAAMLIGAIAVATSAHSRCSRWPDRHWAYRSPMVVLDPKDTINTSGLLKGLLNRMDYLANEQFVHTVILESVIKQAEPGHVLDFKDVNRWIGSIKDFEWFLREARQRNQRVILDFDPNHTSDKHPWFEKSARREDHYADYYVWADGKLSSAGEKKSQPPNNWVSINDGSAWTYNEVRGQFYFHQFNSTQPDLNFHNPRVVNEIKDTLIQWIRVGVSGFRLSNVDYLVEDPKFGDEKELISLKTPAGTYASLVHNKTRYRPENYHFVKKWASAIEQYSNGDGFLIVKTDGGTTDPYIANEVPYSIPVSSVIRPGMPAVELNSSIVNLVKGTNAASIDWTDPEVKVWKKSQPAAWKSLMLTTILLPITPIFQVDDTQVAKQSFATLAKSRAEIGFQYGDFKTKILANNSVFVYRRYLRAHSQFYVAYNGDDQHHKAAVSKLMPGFGGSLEFLADSTHGTDPKHKPEPINGKKVEIPARSMIALYH